MKCKSFLVIVTLLNLIVGCYEIKQVEKGRTIKINRMTGVISVVNHDKIKDENNIKAEQRKTTGQPMADFTGKIPDSIGVIKLGQKNAPTEYISNVEFAGYNGTLSVYPSENGDVETLRFLAGGCYIIEEGEEPCLKVMRELRTKYIKELGNPKSDKKEDIVWEQDGRRLTIGWDSIGGGTEEISIYIEKADDTKPGNINDGFKEFYKKFVQAYNNNDRALLVSMMKFPFEGNCEITIKNPKAFDGNLKKIIGKVEFENMVYCRFETPKMYFSSGVFNGIGFQKIKGKWYAVGYFCAG